MMVLMANVAFVELFLHVIRGACDRGNLVCFGKHEQRQWFFLSQFKEE